MNLYANQPKQKRPISGSAVARIVIWSVVLVILCSIFAASMLAAAFGGIWASFGSFSIGQFHYPDADSYTVGGGTVSETVRDIRIDWFGGEIQILPAEEGATEITVSETFNAENDDADEDDQLRFRVHRGELQIKFRESSWWVGQNHTPRKTLVIRVPRETLQSLGEVEINATGADITFEGDARKLDVESVNGKVTVRGSVNLLDIDSVDADVDFTGTLGEGNFDGVDVRATLRLDAARSLDIDGVDSEVVLYLADTVTGFCVDRDSLGGDMTVNGFEGVTSRGDYSHYWGDGSLRIESDGVDCKLKIEKLTNN